MAEENTTKRVGTEGGGAEKDNARREFLKKVGEAGAILALSPTVKALAQLQQGAPQPAGPAPAEKGRIVRDFVKEMKERATREFLAISGQGVCTEKTVTFQRGEINIATIRGGAIEKAALTHIIIKGIKIPGTDEMTETMVYQMEVFPANPYCPMAHFNAELGKDGAGPYYVNLDLFPAVWVQPDLDMMKGAMDRVADQFGIDRNKMREGLDTHYSLEHWTSPLVSKTGCKLSKLGEKDLDLLFTAYRTFFDTYLDILRRRKESQFGEKEELLKLERNGKWLEYITLKDRAFKGAQTQGVPAEVLIRITFPPSAVIKDEG